MEIKLNREAWEPCEKCTRCVSCAHVLESVVDVSSTCHDCKSYRNFVPQNYCPRCGRPLTDAAWVELEERLRRRVE